MTVCECLVAVAVSETMITMRHSVSVIASCPGGQGEFVLQAQRPEP